MQSLNHRLAVVFVKLSALTILMFSLASLLTFSLPTFRPYVPAFAKQSDAPSVTTFTAIASYYVRPQIKARIKPTGRTQAGIRPALLLTLEDRNSSTTSILGLIHDLAAKDDVLGPDFLASDLTIQQTESTNLDARQLVRSLRGTQPLANHNWELETVHLLLTGNNRPPLPDGPYFLEGLELHEAWKLHSDHLEAFQTTVIPVPGDQYRFQILDRIAVEGTWKTVAVPSRLYSIATPEKPLAGLRIAVKDLFKLTGIRTSLNVRSFLETYGPEQETASYVKKLIDLGAHIVGKTRMTAFAAGEKAPEYWIDFQCPFNPRADGYQAPGGSTAGGAAALAGYEWLDFSIGSDTYGSIREPAAVQGLIGLRSTTGAGDMKGTHPESPIFDTIGLLGRDLNMFRALAANTLRSAFQTSQTSTHAILYPTDWLPTHDGEQQRHIDKFVAALEVSLGIKKQKINMAELWSRNPPKEANGKSLSDFLNKTGYNPFYYDCYHEYDQFRADHAAKFGTPVYVAPHMRYIWGLGANVTAEERAQSLIEIDIFRGWFASEVLRMTDHDTKSIAIMVLPVGSATPVYRDVLSGPLAPRLGLERMNFASLLRLPQLVVPIGQAEYHSRVTDRTEYLPVAGSIAGPPGSDLVLMEIVQNAMERAGYKTRVETGRFTFARNISSPSCNEGQRDVRCAERRPGVVAEGTIHHKLL